MSEGRGAVCLEYNSVFMSWVEKRTKPKTSFAVSHDFPFPLFSSSSFASSSSSANKRVKRVEDTQRTCGSILKSVPDTDDAVLELGLCSFELLEGGCEMLQFLSELGFDLV